MTAAPSPRPALRVASVPADHPYIAGLALDRHGVALLPDPRPPGAPPGRWWPPVVLSSAWISAHADAFDVLHVHFGTESLSLKQLSSALDALDRADRPLVLTVHDLQHPWLIDQSHYRAQLDLLVPRARELTTLTAGAADEITRGWGRTAVVIPHPRMRPTAGRPLLPTANGDCVVAVHLRELRPNVAGPRVVRALVRAVARLRARHLPVRGHVSMFEHVHDRGAQAFVRATCAGAPGVTLREGPRPDDAALAAELAALHLSVLPYAHGTHSGWAELCWDLGVPVAGAPVGHIREQHSEPGWFLPCDPGDADSLAAVMESVVGAHPDELAGARAVVQHDRRRQRDDQELIIARAHLGVYARAVG